MKRYQLFLAYYTLIATLALFIASIFFAPKPQGFLLTLFVIPISIYFWFLVSGASKHHPSDPSSQNQNRGGTKFPLIVLIILFISTFSIFAYSEITNRPQNLESESATYSQQISSLKLDLEKQNKEFSEIIARELGRINSELINIKGVQKVNVDSTVMGDTTSQVGTVTISDKKYPTVDVYLEKSISSKVVAKAEFGKTYTFIEKDQDWYLILLGAKEGFIRSQFVKEVLSE